MSKAQIVRKSFNGGEIAPELHYRSDLEAYHNSCKSLKNMTVTPWGAATRRPPTELLAKIDTATYGIPVKYVPFRFSLTETFHIIFTDGTGSAGTGNGQADIIVFDADGVMQTLTGASDKVINSPYLPADLLSYHFIQVNDFIYSTCGGKYPVQALNRFFDEGQAENRWKIEEWVFTGSPMLDENIDPDNTLEVQIRSYDSSETYAEGDLVYGISAGLSLEFADWQYVSSGRYRLRLKDTSHGLTIGEKLYIDGVVLSSPGSWVYAGSTNPAVGTLSGETTVTKMDNSNFFSTSFYIEGSGGLPTINIGAAEYWELVNYGSLYKSVAGSNTGQLISDEAWWISVESSTDEVTVTGDFDNFKSTDVGRVFRLKLEDQSGNSGKWVNDQVSGPFVAFERIILTTEGGFWGGKLSLQESIDNGDNWDTIGTIISEDGGSNGSLERDVVRENAIYRVKLSGYSRRSNVDAKPVGCLWKLEFPSLAYSYFKVLSLNSAKSVQARPITPLMSPWRTYKWSFGAFSEATGYAKTLTIHDERMILGGSDTKPNTIWASRVNDWTNFFGGDTDVSPYTFTIKSDSFDTIRWLRSTRNLMIGTENSESTMGTRDDSAVVSPTNIDVQTHTYFGSANIQAVVTADLVFFVQGQKQRVRSTQYDFGTDQYLSSEMSILAHHITAPGIKEMSFRRHPYSSIFFVLEDGRAVSFTYERDNQVKGWARMEFGGGAFIVSAASNYSDAGDIIGGIVKRGSEYTLETFGSFDSGTVYLDGQTQSASGWAAGKLLPYADTSGLVVVMDDVLLIAGTDYTWSGSTLTIPGHTDETVTVGWPFEFELQPTDIIELGDHGAQKRISKLSLYLLASGGCDIEVNGEDCPFQEGDSLAAGSRLSGEHQISVGGGTESAIQIKLSGNHHQPFNLSAFGVFGQASR